VYAASATPVFTTGAATLRPINIADAKEVHELVPAVDQAVTVGRQHDPSERLIIHQGGLVQPYPADQYQHMARRIENGQARELSLAERMASAAGRRQAADGLNSQQRTDSQRRGLMGDVGGKVTSPARPRSEADGPQCGTGAYSRAPVRRSAAAAEPARRRR
jgi:hypothetical protein